jgi:hypothetical protein
MFTIATLCLVPGSDYTTSVPLSSKYLTIGKEVVFPSLQNMVMKTRFFDGQTFMFIGSFLLKCVCPESYIKPVSQIS